MAKVDLDQQVSNGRTDRITWDDHHMLLALMTSQRSKDPNTQVGACLVDAQNRVVGLGYNGFPRGISNCYFPWFREADDILNTKYPYVVHAEKNAIANSVGDTTGCTLYVTLFPCNECTKDLIQAGVHNVVYLEDKYANSWQSQASRRMMDFLDIPYDKHIWSPETASCLNKLVNSLT